MSHEGGAGAVLFTLKISGLSLYSLRQLGSLKKVVVFLGLLSSDPAFVDGSQKVFKFHLLFNSCTLHKTSTYLFCSPEVHLKYYSGGAGR